MLQFDIEYYGPALPALRHLDPANADRPDWRPLRFVQGPQAGHRVTLRLAAGASPGHRARALMQLRLDAARAAGLPLVDAPPLRLVGTGE